MFPKVFSRIASDREVAHAANWLVAHARKQAADMNVELTDIHVEISHIKEHNFLVAVVAKGSWAHEEIPENQG